MAYAFPPTALHTIKQQIYSFFLIISSLIFLFFVCPVTCHRLLSAFFLASPPSFTSTLVLRVRPLEGGEQGKAHFSFFSLRFFYSSCVALNLVQLCELYFSIFFLVGSRSAPLLTSLPS